MKANINIEMTDEEYENYKKFLNNDFIDEIDLVDFLKAKGYEQTNLFENPEVISNKTMVTVEYKNKDTTVVIRGLV